MGRVGAAESIISIASAGNQISIKLSTLAEQCTPSSGLIDAFAHNVALTSLVLQHLAELVTRKQPEDDVGIFNESGLQAAMASAKVCKSIFHELRNDFEYATAQIRSNGKTVRGMVGLPQNELPKWPFSQTRVRYLRTDLLEAKEKLLLISQVATLAYSRKVAKLNNSKYLSDEEEQDLVGYIRNVQVQLKAPKKPKTHNLAPIPEAKEVIDLVNGAENHPSSEDISRVENIKAAEGNATNTPKSELDTTKKSSFLTKQPTKELQITETAINDNSSRISGDDEIIILYHSRWKSALRRVLSFLRLSRRQSMRRPEQVESESGNGTLRIYFQKPRISCSGRGRDLEIYWITQMQEMEQNDLESELAHDRRRGQPSLAEQLTTLSSDEDQRIQDLLFDLDCEAVLVSVRRTCTEIKYEGMIFRNIPIVRFIIRLEGAVPKGDSSITAAETNKSEIKQQETNKKEDTIDASQEKTKEASGSGKVSGEPIESGSSEGNKDSPRFDRGRPTYIRVHRKHLSPETLNDYHLPWEWDFLCSDYIIIKQWIPEPDQDILFEHTRKLRQRGLYNPYNPRPWGEGDQSTTISRTIKEAFEPLALSNVNEAEESKNDIVDEVLAKYTTLFD